MTDDERDVRDTRWFRTVDLSRHQIDGNPAHPHNGGIAGLANEHCLASIANHCSPSNAFYETVLNHVTPRAYLELEKRGNETPDQGLYQCMLLRATVDIYPDQQIFGNYEPKTSEKYRIVFGNDTHVQFLLDTISVLRGKCEVSKKWFKAKASRRMH